MFFRSARRFLERPGAFYTLLLVALCVVQLSSLLAFLYAGDAIRAAIPAYTHLLSLTLGTVFLFRGLQLLGALLWGTVLGHESPLPPYAPDRPDLPRVTVQIPVRNEPIEVARISIDSAFALDYPADRLEIQVIDNSDSEEFTRPIERLLEDRAREAARLGRRPAARFLHRDGSQGFKAGNLNLGMASAHGEFFLLLDADSCTPADALSATLPYFEDPSVGFVQMRIDATNEEANLITRAAAITTRARYKLMAVRNTQGIVQFDGHNGVFRREALERVGGWSEQISEDLATSVKVVLAGYRAVYADLPSGELVPAHFNELMRQRKRWATGTMVFLRQDALAILKSPHLRWFEKLDLFYAVLNIFVEALACILIFTFAPLPALTAIEILFVFSVVPTFLTGGFGFWKTLRRQASLTFVISAILPALVQGAIEGLPRRVHSFAVTRKVGAGRLPFSQLLRVHAFGFSAAIVFFAVAAWITAGFAEFLDSYLPGALVMGAALVAPIVLND